MARFGPSLPSWIIGRNKCCSGEGGLEREDEAGEGAEEEVSFGRFTTGLLLSDANDPPRAEHSFRPTKFERRIKGQQKRLGAVC